MGVNNSLDSIREIWLLLVLTVKIPVFIIGCIAQPFILYLHRQDEKRRIARMLSFARRLGLTLDPDIRSGMKKKYRFLRNVRGRGQYALNIMTGKYKGHEITMFDYHTRAIAGDASVWEYSRWYEHNYQSFLVLDLGQDFPSLTIALESKFLGLFARVADACGFGDIDFESHEFSDKFNVRSKGKKFAYDFCNAQMMEYLLDQKVLHLPIEVDKSALAIGIDSELRMQNVEENLGRLLAIRERMPNYLFTD